MLGQENSDSILEHLQDILSDANLCNAMYQLDDCTDWSKVESCGTVALGLALAAVLVAAHLRTPTQADFNFLTTAINEHAQTLIGPPALQAIIFGMETQMWFLDYLRNIKDNAGGIDKEPIREFLGGYFDGEKPWVEKYGFGLFFGFQKQAFAVFDNHGITRRGELSLSSKAS